MPSWNDAAGYERYVGHWSRAIARRFVAWLEVAHGLRWLDVACGTGALSCAICECGDPAETVAIDASGQYIEAARKSCRDARAQFIIGDANVLAFAASTFDVAVSGLALNFLGQERALAEQYRVVRPGGMIAAYVWDYSGEYEFARRFWDAALSIDPRAASYDPGRIFEVCREQRLHHALVATGCEAVGTRVFDHWCEFPSRESYWQTFDARQGSTAEYLSLLTNEQRSELQAVVLSRMRPDGPVKLKARALAVKGVRK